MRPLHLELHPLLPSFPPVLLPLPLLPIQRRAAAGAQQEDHGKSALLRTYDVLYLPTGYEPNGHDFNELQNSSVPLSYKIPAADQDVDDLTLSEMLTEAYRGQVDYFVREGVSVSQSSSVRFDGSGQPDGEMVDRSWQPDERNSSKAQIRTLLEDQRQTLLRNVTQESVITNSKQLKPKKSADSYKDNYGSRNWNFVKLINEVLQRWKNYENFRVLPSIL